VLDAILKLFDDREKDNDWHGACLAMAELARRGLLLPHRLSEVIPHIVDAIHVRVPRVFKVQHLWKDLTLLSLYCSTMFRDAKRVSGRTFEMPLAIPIGHSLGPMHLKF
jgi:hypothetical protein